MWHQNPRMSMSFTTSKGLLNAPGANNCFLNSAVQVLWHLDVFRRNFRLLSGHSCMGNSCIFCALKVIFTQFQYSDQSALPPDALRKALAKTFHDQQRFQMGLMDDAAECFENILMRIHSHLTNNHSEDMCSARHCIPHQQFAQTVVEQIVCGCGVSSEPHSYTQMVQYVSTNALCEEARSMRHQRKNAHIPDHLYGPLLRKAFSRGNDRKCSGANCGATVTIKRNLINCPQVLSLGLIWDSEHPSSQSISDVIQAIGTTLRLPDLFDTSVNGGSSQHSDLGLQLVGVVCYYGKHYSTFFLHSKLHEWISFDDATVKQMGDWAQVADKCCRGHYQPLLLLYADPNATQIDISSAPDKTTMVPGCSFNNDPRHAAAVTAADNQQSSQHARQGSASSVDRTLRPGGQKAHHPPQQQQRSRTPNPDDLLHSDVTADLPERRAITPGPEWGRYDSDSEEASDVNSKTGDHKHFRQSSYLTAMEELSNSAAAMNNQTPHSFDANIGSYNVNKATAAYTSARQNNAYDSVDNSHNYSQSRYSSTQGHGQGQSNSSQYNNTSQYSSSRYGNSDYSQYPASASQQQQQQHTRNNQAPYMSALHNNQVPLQNGLQTHHNYQPHLSHASSQETLLRQAAPAASHAPKVPTGFQLNTNSPHNAVYTGQGYSNEQSYAPTQKHSQQSKYAQPQSYGYPSNTGTAATVSHQHAHSSNTQSYDSQAQYTTRQGMSHSQLSNSQSMSHSRASSTDSDTCGSYINAKAVEKVLGMQGKNPRAPRTSNYAQVQIPPVNKVVVESRSNHADQTRHVTQTNQYSDYQQTSNRYINQSHSQYSTAPANQQAVTHSQQYAQYNQPAATQPLPQQPAHHAPQLHNQSSSRPSAHVITSTDRTTVNAQQAPSRSLYPSVVIGNGIIPSRIKSKSEESLAIIEDNTKPVRDLVKQLDTKVHVGEVQVQQRAPRSKPPAPQRTTSIPSSQSAKSAPHNSQAAPVAAVASEASPSDALYVQADSLIASANKKETQGDLHTALAHINRAIGCLQQLLSQASTSPDTLVHVRIKHNGAVLKSRALLHNIQSAPSRQHSNSTVSSDDLSSLSSINTDTSDGRGSHSSREPATKSYEQQTKHALQQSKPLPSPFDKVYSNDSRSALTTHDDFPRMSQRRKFLSDYVSREDYFSHHPPPPNYNKPAAASSQQRSLTAPHQFDLSVPKPSLPPKPAVQPKPRLKHSISSDKSMSKVYPEVDETGGINIYATLPRRPKNRERSSTLSSHEQREAYQAYVNSQTVARDGQASAATASRTGATGEQHDTYHPYENLPPTNQHYTNKPVSSQASHVRQNSRDDVSQSDYIPRLATDSDEHNLSIESMVTQQIQQLTLTKPHNSSSSSGIKQHSNRLHSSHNHSQSNGSIHTQQQQQGPFIQRVLPQRSVNTSSPLPVYPHPPTYHGSGAVRQNSVESHSSNESSASNLSKLEAHQLALMHQRSTTTNNCSQGGAPVQVRYPQKHDMRKSASNSHISASQSASKGHIIASQSAINSSSTTSSQSQRQQQHHASVKLVESPKRSKHMGGQRTGDGEGRDSSASHAPLSSFSQLDSSDFTHLQAPVSLGETRHGDSRDTLVTDESAFSSCIVVDGCEYVVEKASTNSSSAHVIERSHVTDSDLRDFCVIEHVTAGGGGSAGGVKPKKVPSDCSSSSGIERTDQSDTSSYTSRTPETKSVLVKRKKQKAFKSRKSVTFSDKVALVSTAPEEVAPQKEPDYIAYVQALLKRSPGKRGGMSGDSESETSSTAPSTPLPTRSATPVADPGGKSGYDSDFDEETDDSCGSDDLSGGDKVQCNLCRKKLIEVTQMFCADCNYYMSQFAPTVS